MAPDFAPVRTLLALFAGLFGPIACWPFANLRLVLTHVRRMEDAARAALVAAARAAPRVDPPTASSPTRRPTPCCEANDAERRRPRLAQIAPALRLPRGDGAASGPAIARNDAPSRPRPLEEQPLGPRAALLRQGLVLWVQAARLNQRLAAVRRLVETPPERLAARVARLAQRLPPRSNGPTLRPVQTGPILRLCPSPPGTPPPRAQAQAGPDAHAGPCPRITRLE